MLTFQLKGIYVKAQLALECALYREHTMDLTAV